MTAGRKLRLCAALLAAATLLLEPSPAAARRNRRGNRTLKLVAADFDTKLPVLGTRLAEFPAGPVKPVADWACLSCHSADMVWQQRLNEKQWTANVNKMIGWGAVVREDQKNDLVAYLVKNFGPDNEKFEPVLTRPVGK